MGRDHATAPAGARRAVEYSTAVRRWIATALVALAPGCGACGGHGASVDGPHPYVRCTAVDAPDPREGTAGSLAFAIDERTLTLTGRASELRIAAFRGPGRDDDAALAPALEGVGPESTDLVVVLGGLGATEGAVARVLESVAARGVAALVLPGGEDDARAVDDGFDAVDRGARDLLFDGRALRLVRFGTDELVLAPGAPEGRYARDSGACGISEDDLESLADDVGDPDDGVRRWLVSWAAPTGGGPASASLGFGGVEAGDPRIAELAEAVKAAGGLFAFPETRALLPSPADGSRVLAPGEASPTTRLVLPIGAGLPVEREDGTLVRAGVTRLTLGPGGLALSAAPAAHAAFVQGEGGSGGAP